MNVKTASTKKLEKSLKGMLSPGLIRQIKTELNIRHKQGRS